MTDASPYDPLPDYVAAAHGDPDACFRLSAFARTSVLDGSDDVLTASMEGATLARLAALRGNVLAAVLMSQHMVSVAETYEAAGDSSHAECVCAEALAILELIEAYPPPGWDAAAWSDHILALVTQTATNTNASFMESTKHYRDIWAPFLAPPPAQPTGDLTQ